MDLFSNTESSIGNYSWEFFEGLFMQYSEPSYYYASRNVDKEATCEIGQDIFVKTWSKKQISIRKSINNLLFTMVRNSYLLYPRWR